MFEVQLHQTKREHTCNIPPPSPFQLFVNLKTIDLNILTVYIHAETLGLVVFEIMICHVPLNMV